VASRQLCEQLASAVAYFPSSEHKDQMTAGMVPRLRSDATACPHGLDLGLVESWLREALRAGNFSAAEDNGFPRYVWAAHEGRVYEGRLTNSGQGHYKGYPLDDSERPAWL
jgi:hypothetical protein